MEPKILTHVIKHDTKFYSLATIRMNVPHDLEDYINRICGGVAGTI